MPPHGSNQSAKQHINIRLGLTGLEGFCQGFGQGNRQAGVRSWNLPGRTAPLVVPLMVTLQASYPRIKLA
jgi:hypothetical protein